MTIIVVWIYIGMMMASAVVALIAGELKSRRESVPLRIKDAENRRN